MMPSYTWCCCLRRCFHSSPSGATQPYCNACCFWSPTVFVAVAVLSSLPYALRVPRLCLVAEFVASASLDTRDLLSVAIPCRLFFCSSLRTTPPPAPLPALSAGSARSCFHLFPFLVFVWLLLLGNGSRLLALVALIRSGCP